MYEFSRIISKLSITHLTKFNMNQPTFVNDNG